jgi:hypothetical protein
LALQISLSEQHPVPQAIKEHSHVPSLQVSPVPHSPQDFPQTGSTPHSKLPHSGSQVVVSDEQAKMNIDNRTTKENTNLLIPTFLSLNMLLKII